MFRHFAALGVALAVGLFSLGDKVYAGDPVEYRVQPGDTVWGIPWRYGVSPAEIAQLNGLRNANLIYAGQRLLIPPPPAGPVHEATATEDEESWFPVPFRISQYCLQGRMASGQWVHEGAAAADASVFAFGTVVEVEGLGTFVVLDRFGWDANMNRLDVWTPDCRDAFQWGIRYRRVRIVHEP